MVTCLFCCLGQSNLLNGQTIIQFSIEQPEFAFSSDAGVDQQYDGVNTIVLGGDPTVIGGFGDYTYLWNNEEFLNDATLANPEVSNLSGPTTFIIQVTDLQNDCIQEDEVFVDYVVSNENAHFNHQVNAFPNPFNKELKIESSQIIKRILLLDLTGKMLKEIQPNASEMTIVASELSQGVYFIRLVFSDQSTKTLQVCKQDY